MNLRNYIWIYENYFTEEEVKTINAMSERVPFQIGKVGNKAEDPDGEIEGGTEDSHIRQSDVKWFDHDFLPEELTEKLHAGIDMANAEAGWHHEWTWPEPHQYTVYNHRPDSPVTGDHYTWHTDSSDMNQSDHGIRKLSSTVQLSHPDDYEGGHFQYINYQGVFDKLGRNTNIDAGNYINTVPFSAKSIGSLIVFPSFVYHQVTPVTKGTRISLVSWFHGKPYV